MGRPIAADVEAVPLEGIPEVLEHAVFLGVLVVVLAHDFQCVHFMPDAASVASVDLRCMVAALGLAGHRHRHGRVGGEGTARRGAQGQRCE